MNKYMEELTELLQTGLEEYATSEKYRDLLRVMSLFHNYSANNCLLIALQCPHTKCCRQTVTVAMKVLQKTNFIKKIQNGVWMVNPEILLKGNDAKQFMLMSNFKSASSEMEKKDES